MIFEEMAYKAVMLSCIDLEEHYMIYYDTKLIKKWYCSNCDAATKILFITKGCFTMNSFRYKYVTRRCCNNHFVHPLE